MLNACRERWINDLVCGLKRLNIRIVPRVLGVCSLFYYETDEPIPKVETDVRREVLNSRINLCFADNRWEREGWEHRFCKLDNVMLAWDRGRKGGSYLLALNLE